MDFRIYAEIDRWQAARLSVNCISRIRHLIGEWKPDFHAAQPRLGIEVLAVEVEHVGEGAGLATRCGRRHCQDVLRTTGKLPGGHRETAGAQVAVEFLVDLCRDFGKAMARPKWRSMYQIALVTGCHEMASWAVILLHPSRPVT